jgi:hypothetical protein
MKTNSQLRAASSKTESLLSSSSKETADTTAYTKDTKTNIESQTKKLLKELLSTAKTNKTTSAANKKASNTNEKKDIYQKLIEKHFVEGVIIINKKPKTFEDHKKAIAAYLEKVQYPGRKEDENKRVGHSRFTVALQRIANKFFNNANADKVIDIKAALLSDSKFAATVLFNLKDSGAYAKYFQDDSAPSRYDFKPKSPFDSTTFNAKLKDLKDISLPTEREVAEIIDSSSFNRSYLKTHEEEILQIILKYIQENNLTKEQLEQIRAFYLKVLDYNNSQEPYKTPEKKSSPRGRGEILNSAQKPITRNLSPQDLLSPHYKSSDNIKPGNNQTKKTSANELIYTYYYHQKQQAKPNKNQDNANDTTQDTVAKDNDNANFSKKADFLGFGKIDGLNQMQADFVRKIATIDEGIKFARLGSDTGSGKSAIVSDRLFPVLITPRIEENKDGSGFVEKNLENFAEALLKVVESIKKENQEDIEKTLKKVIRLGEEKSEVNSGFYEKLAEADDTTKVLKLLKDNNKKDTAQGAYNIHIQPTLFANYYHDYKVININAQDYLKDNGFDTKKLVKKVKKELGKDQKLSLNIDEAHLLSTEAKEDLKKTLSEARLSGNVTLISATLPANSVSSIKNTQLEPKQRSNDREGLLGRLIKSLAPNNDSQSKNEESLLNYTSQPSLNNSPVISAPNRKVVQQQTTNQPALSASTRKNKASSPATLSPITSSSNSILVPADKKGTVVYNGALGNGDFSIKITPQIVAQGVCTAVSLSENIVSSIQDYKSATNDQEGKLFVFPVRSEDMGNSLKPTKFIVTDSKGEPLSKNTTSKTSNSEDFYFSAEELAKNIELKQGDGALGKNFVYFSPTAEGHNPPFATLDETKFNPYREVISILPKDHFEKEDITTINSTLYQIRGRARQKEVELKVYSKENNKLTDFNAEAVEIAKAESLYREKLKNSLSNKKATTDSSENEYYNRTSSRFATIYQEKYGRYAKETTLAEKFLLANINFNANKNGHNNNKKELATESAKIFNTEGEDSESEKKLKDLFTNTLAHSLAHPGKTEGKTNEVIDPQYLNYFDSLLRIEFVKQLAEEAGRNSSILNNTRFNEIKFSIKDGDLVLNFRGFERTYSQLAEGDGSLKGQFKAVAKNPIFTTATVQDLNMIKAILEKARSVLNEALKKLNIELKVESTIPQGSSAIATTDATTELGANEKDIITDNKTSIKDYLDNICQSIAELGKNLTEKDKIIVEKDKTIQRQNQELEVLKTEVEKKEDETKQGKGGNKTIQNVTIDLESDALSKRDKEIEELKQKLKRTEEELEASKKKERESEICRELGIPAGLTFAKIGEFMLGNWEAVYGEESQEEKQKFQETVKAIKDYIGAGESKDEPVNKMKQEIGLFCSNLNENINDNGFTFSKTIKTSASDNKTKSYDPEGKLKNNINNILCLYQEKPFNMIKGDILHNLNNTTNLNK